MTYRFLLAALLLGLLAPATHAQFAIPDYAIASGGTVSANGSMTLYSTVGQTATGVSSGADFQLQAGLWHRASDAPTTGVSTEADGVPDRFQLHGNYPNPFNPSTTIAFDVPETTTLTLSVYDALGRRVATLADGPYAPGRYEIAWTARSDRGGELPSGLYLYRIETAGFAETRSMSLVR
ncbi:MAG: T9SS type A sorting domain-containing protein [Bacteroidota bacterium]